MRHSRCRAGLQPARRRRAPGQRVPPPAATRREDHHLDRDRPDGFSRRERTPSSEIGSHASARQPAARSPQTGNSQRCDRADTAPV